MITNLLTYLIVVLFILLWIYASVPKLFNLRRFREVLKSQAIPKWLANLLSWTLPFLELIIAGMLIFPESRLMGLYLSFFMMLIFTIYVSGIIFHVYNIYPCPCGALFRRMGWKKHFKVNILLTSIALIGIVLIELG